LGLLAALFQDRLTALVMTEVKRMANDPSLTPNPVANGRQGRYVYAADATALDLAFTRVASEILRLAK